MTMSKHEIERALIELLSVITKFSGLMFTFSDGQGGKGLRQNGTGIATGAVLAMGE